MLSDNENSIPNFYIRPDGTFRAFMGDVLLKAEKLGDTEGYPFEGIASTADKDREDESLLQKGLNFEPFKEYGEFNWNHIPHAMVGVPDGKKAWFDENCWHSQGLILKGMPIWDGYDTDMVVKQHNNLKKAGLPRGLCQSVEGKVTQRSKDKKNVMKADIFNIALTFRPINPKCSISMLAKSMRGQAEIVVLDDGFYKSAVAAHSIGAFTKQDKEGATGDNLATKLVRHLMRKGYSQGDARSHVFQWMKKFSGR